MKIEEITESGLQIKRLDFCSDFAEQYSNKEDNIGVTILYFDKDNNHPYM